MGFFLSEVSQLPPGDGITALSCKQEIIKGMTPKNHLGSLWGLFLGLRTNYSNKVSKMGVEFGSTGKNCTSSSFLYNSKESSSNFQTNTFLCSITFGPNPEQN